MIKADENSNAQCWELEIACKNIFYKNAVVDALKDFGMLSYEVEVGERLCSLTKDPADWNSRYTILIWCSWFNNLAPLALRLEKIERELEGWDTEDKVNQ
jgi:hypothetical protein